MLYGGNYTEERVFSIDSHQEWRYGSAYVSVTTDFRVALAIVHNEGYIYRIRCPPNPLDLNLALGTASRYPMEQEFVALGGIPYNFIISWVQYSHNLDLLLRSLHSDSVVGELTEEHVEMWARRMQRNPRYNESQLIFPNVETTDETYPWALAGFRGDDAEIANQLPWSNFRLQSLRESALRFMDLFGEGVGWIRGQDFPLWNPGTQPQSNETGSACLDGNSDCSTASDHSSSPSHESQSTSPDLNSPSALLGEGDRLHFDFEGFLRGPALADLWLQSHCETYYDLLGKRQVAVETQGIVDSRCCYCLLRFKLTVSYS